MTIGNAIDKLFSHNEIIALWYETDKHFKVLFWRSEAWKLGKQMRKLKIDKIFGTIPEKITYADTVNILIKDKPIHVCCGSCRYICNAPCEDCCSADGYPQWDWILRFGEKREDENY